MDRCPRCGKGRQIEEVTRTCGLASAELRLRLTDWKPGPWQELRQQRAQAMAAMAESVAKPAGFLTFWGDYGSGKTMALQIIVNELRLQGIRAHYAPFALLADTLRELTFGDRKDAAERYWQWITEAQVLAVDEITRFNPTGWAQERLWVLADTRYRRRDEFLTVLATNDDPREPLPTSEPVGYLFSRMREGFLLELRGDMRQAAAKEKTDATT